ncbi:hypothetical protein B3286c1_1259 [Brucella vulpis]|nr:hypothetical protein BF3285c1_1260 [Brucella vulpis]CUW50072.1 hypothetical protein B3286c1_1259 [Brucella vulpis]
MIDLAVEIGDRARSAENAKRFLIGGRPVRPALFFVALDGQPGSKGGSGFGDDIRTAGNPYERIKQVAITRCKIGSIFEAFFPRRSACIQHSNSTEPFGHLLQRIGKRVLGVVHATG